MAEPSGFMEIYTQLYAQWFERGARIAAVKGYECGVLDAAEGKTVRETLPCDVHRMFEGDYCRGYREGFYHGNE